VVSGAEQQPPPPFRAKTPDSRLAGPRVLRQPIVRVRLTSGATMDFLYSLYDALVSIHVPNDKARAVVDAMERDMATHLATKTDLDSLRLATKADVELLRHETTSGFAAARKDLETSLALVRRDMDAGFDALRSEMRGEIAAVRKEIESQGIALRKDIESQGSALRKDIESQGAALRQDIALLRKDMEAQGSQIVIRLGALIVVMAGLMLGAMQLGA